MNLDIVVNNRHACVGGNPVFSVGYKILDTLFRGHDDFLRDHQTFGVATISFDNVLTNQSL